VNTLRIIRKLPLLASALLVALVLSACGGGGGNNNPNPPPVVAPPPAPNSDPVPAPNPVPPPPNFNTTEYRQNYGLGAINTIAAYEDGLSGDGIVVAVIDNGIDQSSDADLTGNLSPDSTDIIASRNSLSNDDPHGTIVASIVAAEKNNFGTHGVAYEAEILAIRADSPDHCDDDGCAFLDPDIARAVDYAIANDADIINLSLAGDAPNTAGLNAALDRAVDAGMIIVLAAGNDAEDDPDASTFYALRNEANGQALIVGATDENDNIWVYDDPDTLGPDGGSNKAGPNAQGVFVVAPGSEISAGCEANACWVASGTSMAAPHVAGAAALLLEEFPNLSAREVVDILLSSAQDLGAAGPDAVYGMGLIDIEAALEPIGPMSITTRGGDKITVSDGGIMVSAAFGDALTTSPKAAAAFGNILATDAYDRTYALHLGAMNANLPNGRFDLSSRARSRVYGHHTAVQIDGLGLVQFGYTDNWGVFDEADLFPHLNRDPGRLVDNVSLSLHYQLDDHTVMSVHHGAALRDGFVNLNQQKGAALFARNNAFMRFSEDGTGMSLSRSLTAKTRLSVLATYADYQPVENARRLSRSMAAFQLDHQLSERFAAAVRLGSIHEDGSTLNMVADGAYDAFGKADTLFATINLAYVRQRLSLEISASFGSTQTGKSKGDFFTDVSTLHSTAFSLSARWQTKMPGHFLSFGISQPLRIENGHVMVNAPTGRNLSTEAFSFSQAALPLSPSGREFDIEIGHLFQGQNGLSLATNFAYRINPDHNAQAKGAIAFLSHIQLSF